jgi:hypothetical protein
MPKSLAELLVEVEQELRRAACALLDPELGMRLGVPGASSSADRRALSRLALDAAGEAGSLREFLRHIEAAGGSGAEAADAATGR